MKILIGCDVDPVLPRVLRARPNGDVWRSLDGIPRLMERAGAGLPALTWLLRADASVRFCTGAYDSAYVARSAMWESLRSSGHELGWHIHAMSFDPARGRWRFDPSVPWLEEAHGTLVRHFPVFATRTGWDYADGNLLRRIARLGVRLDFSALPGARGWIEGTGDSIPVDWQVTSSAPYRPSGRDHRRPGLDALPILEVPITQFRARPVEIARRVVWRLLHGETSTLGLTSRTRLLTLKWKGIPKSDHGCMAFYFHPEDLLGAGMDTLLGNIERLRALQGCEFVTARALADWLEPRVPRYGSGSTV
jgi:hypothetical protein